MVEAGKMQKADGSLIWKKWLFLTYPKLGKDGEIFLDSDYKQILSLGTLALVSATSILHVKRGFSVRIQSLEGYEVGVLMWEKMRSKEGLDLFHKWVENVFAHHRDTLFGTSYVLYIKKKCGDEDELSETKCKPVKEHDVLYVKPPEPVIVKLMKANSHSNFGLDDTWTNNVMKSPMEFENWISGLFRKFSDFLGERTTVFTDEECKIPLLANTILSEGHRLYIKPIGGEAGLAHLQCWPGNLNMPKHPLHRPVHPPRAGARRTPPWMSRTGIPPSP